MYKKIEQFTQEEQVIISETCTDEFLINSVFEYFEINGVKQKKRNGDEIKRPSILTFENRNNINQKYNYQYKYPNAKSGLNFLTYQIN